MTKMMTIMVGIDGKNLLWCGSWSSDWKMVQLPMMILVARRVRGWPKCWVLQPFCFLLVPHWWWSLDQSKLFLNITHIYWYTSVYNYIIKCVSIHIWNLGMLQRGYPKNCSIRDPFRPKKLSMFVISFVPENFEYPDIQIFRILLSISGLFDSTR